MEMDKQFMDSYDDWLCDTHLEHLADTPHIIEMLQDKAAFGLQKYGSDSFQTSYENARSVDVVQHLIEEKVDSINYAMHILWQIDNEVIGSELKAELQSSISNDKHTLRKLLAFKNVTNETSYLAKAVKKTQAIDCWKYDGTPESLYEWENFSGSEELDISTSESGHQILLGDEWIKIKSGDVVVVSESSAAIYSEEEFERDFQVV